MENPKKKTKKKIIIIVLAVLLALILLLIGAALLLMKSYLGKIDYDHDDAGGEQTVSLLSDEEIEHQLLEEEPDSTETDSPEEEIAALEEQISAQLQNQEDTQMLSSENVLNVLLIGCDSRKQGGSGRSDTMILVSVNEDTEKIHMTSIMRDSYVSIPGKGNNRINAAYA